MKLYILLLITVSISFNAYSKIMIAKITTNMAVVYKDALLFSPMGYIKRGKKIRIKFRGQENLKVLPILIEGKIGYIKSSDISMPKDFKIDGPKIKEHDIDYSFLTKTQQLASRNSAYLFFGVGSAGNDWQNLSHFLEDNNEATMKNFSIEIVHHPKNSKLLLGIGIEKLGLNQKSAELSVLLGKIGPYYILYEREKFRLEINLSFLFSGDAQLNSSYNSDPSRGLAYGARGSLFLRFFPRSKIGTIFGVFKQRINFSSLEPILNFDENEYTLRSLSGTAIYAGLSYRF